MRKISAFLMAAVLLLATACGRSAEETTVPGDVYAETNAEPKVTVSRFVNFGLINEAEYGSFTEPGQIRAFESAISSAERIPGLLDVAFADYDVVIERDGVPQAIHLWVDEAGAKGSKGMYMDASDTGTGYNLTEEATKELYELIHGLEYTSEAAERNGDVVIGLRGVANAERWTGFADNVESKKPDDVQVTAYTIEGDPIFYNLIFDGETIQYRFDNAHDAFGNPQKLVDFCGSVTETKTDEGTEYRLAACGANKDETNETFSIVIP
ncbi:MULTISPECIES: DUF4362 domain-containing protein [Cohnella]|uniref:DUF4362 domain-containing protein n=1 Tax=Cohnella TaxID=329857 RepID=UPI0009B97497|nr:MULTISPECIES: DUF4362 domain-containing protein [Cohnella]MBN2980305.1 DUF4362 domain-containing protein [Cohnella algarum]